MWTHAPSRFILPTPSAGYSTATDEFSGSPWLFTNNTRHAEFILPHNKAHGNANNTQKISVYSSF